MVRDRLKELRANQPIDKNGENEKFIVTIQDSSSLDLEQTYKKVEDINKNIQMMSNLVSEMRRTHSSLLSSPVVVESSKNMLDDINIQFKVLSKKVKENLTVIQLEIVDIAAKGEKNTAAYRIRYMQHSMLQQKVVEVINQYNIAQVEYRERCKDMLKRQLKITGQNVDAKDLDDMLENSTAEVFTQGIRMDTKAAKEQLEDIQNRHQDILKIEKSIRELHEMFMDMAMLVQQQGEVINRIETHVQNTYDYVEKAREQTKQAMEYQKKARKRKIIIIIILIIILLIIIGVLCWYFIPGSSDSDPSAHTTTTPRAVKSDVHRRTPEKTNPDNHLINMYRMFS